MQEVVRRQRVQNIKNNQANNMQKMKKVIKVRITKYIYAFAPASHVHENYSMSREEAQ